MLPHRDAKIIVVVNRPCIGQVIWTMKIPCLITVELHTGVGLRSRLRTFSGKMSKLATVKATSWRAWLITVIHRKTRGWRWYWDCTKLFDVPKALKLFVKSLVFSSYLLCISLRRLLGQLQSLYFFKQVISPRVIIAYGGGAIFFLCLLVFLFLTTFDRSLSPFC